MDHFEVALGQSAPRAVPRLLAILDYARTVADEFVHKVGGVEPFIVYLHGLYDKYVMPQDIPWVPDLLEPMVDEAAKKLIAGVVRFVHSRVHPE